MSMLLPPFQLHEPGTIREAVELKRRFPESDWVAGGTDLLPNYKWGLNARPHVISLHRVDELKSVSPTRLGSMATLTQLVEDPTLRANLPVIPQTAAQISTPLLRNSGTLGGNLLVENRCFFFNQSYLWRKGINFCLKADGTQCHVVPQESKCYATFSADLPAPLIALGAEFELVRDGGTRRVSAAKFYRNDGLEHADKHAEELLTFVHLPPDAAQFRASYQKLRQRGSWDFPELGIAAACRFQDGVLERFRLVANALEMAPLVLDELGIPHVGRPLTDDVIAQISKEVESRVRPVKNTSLSPSYRKRMSAVYTRRALWEARDGPTTQAPGLG